MLVELLLSLCLPMIYSEHDTNSEHSPSSGTGNIAVHAGVEKSHLVFKDCSTNSNYGASSDHTAHLHKYFRIQSLEDTRTILKHLYPTAKFPGIGFKIQSSYIKK